MNGSSPEIRNDLGCEEKRRQIERILNSATFRSSGQLRRLLDYVATAAIEGHESDIKEYTIGTEVFGRQDFDPRVDTLVRTQAGRLRIRLEAYYRTEGTADEVLVEIPKGHYIPRFSGRSAVPDPGSKPDRLPISSVVAIIVVAIAIAVAVSLYWYARSSARGSPALPAARDPVAQFWTQFVNPQAPPIACFSDHVSLINGSEDQLNYNGPDILPKGTEVDGLTMGLPVAERPLLKAMGPIFYDAGYTGTGEVVAVADLTRVFTRLGSQLIVRRSRLLLSSDLKRHNVIFVGAPSVNPLLQQLPQVGEFGFEGARSGPPLWRARILNLHPRPRESASYGVERDPSSQAIRADYALVSLMPGINPNRRVAVLAGITTEGTQAAADFITSSEGLDEVVHHLGRMSKNGVRVPPRYFQLVLRVEIAGGDVLRVEYVTGRIIHFGS